MLAAQLGEEDLSPAGAPAGTGGWGRATGTSQGLPGKQLPNEPWSKDLMRPQRSWSNHVFPWSTILNLSQEQATALLSRFFNSVLCLAAAAFNWSILFYWQPFRCGRCIRVPFRSVLPLLPPCWSILPLCFVFQSLSNLWHVITLIFYSLDLPGVWCQIELTFSLNWQKPHLNSLLKLASSLLQCNKWQIPVWF